MIARLAIPNIISNLSVPLMGMADIAIAGRVGSDTAIGALSVGTTIFNMIYWNCNFLRMGTSGLTAQSFGREDWRQSLLLLVRSVALALLIALPIILLRTPFSETVVDFMGASEAVSRETLVYVMNRLWAVPASISLFALNGWFIGMQDSRTPMLVAILSNIVNIGSSYYLAIHQQMGLSGVAWGTVIAQYFGVAVSAGVIRLVYMRRLPRISSLTLSECIDGKELKLFFSVNRDIFLRTLCLVTVFTLFTALSSRFGDTVLATNALLMQFFTLYSYMVDGLAHAAESLTGRFVGEGNKELLRTVVRRIVLWGAVSAVVMSTLFGFFWRGVMGFFNPSEVVIGYASGYVGWAVMIPIVSFMAFICDGVMVGATNTRAMRNTMAIATAAFLALAYGLSPLIGETALWIGFETFLLTRGIVLTPQLITLTRA